MQGYGNGVHAPGVRGKAWECVRHALLSHAAAAAAFRDLTPPTARLSLNLNANWAAPWNASDPADVEAAARALDYDLGAFADPLFMGAWPASLVARSPPGLLPWSAAESAALRAARPDYFALNYYTAAWVKSAPGAKGDQGQGVVDFIRIQDGTGLPGAEGRGPIGPRAESAWLYSAPWGLRAMLRHVHAVYGPSSIVITENGADAPGEDAAPWPALLNDTFRVEYFRSHVAAAEATVKEDGVPLVGYFAWSLLDNFECECGGKTGREGGGGGVGMGAESGPAALFLSLSLTFTHTHTNKQKHPLQGPTATPSGSASSTSTTPRRRAASRRRARGWPTGSAGRCGLVGVEVVGVGVVAWRLCENNTER
jgi:beta-glucosidase/6-phospho-beta-glucosidase/beta-galactosidase